MRDVKIAIGLRICGVHVSVCMCSDEYVNEQYS